MEQEPVRENIFDKGRLVMLFLVVGFCPVESNRSHGADQRSLLIFTASKGRIVILSVPTRECLKGVAIADRDSFRACIQRSSSGSPSLTDAGQIIAGNNCSLFVNHTDSTVRTFLHLKDNTLENSAGQCVFSPFSAAKEHTPAALFCSNC